MRQSLLFATLGLAVGIPSLASAQDDATELRVYSNDTCATNANPDVTYDLLIDGAVAANFPPLGASCTCTNGGTKLVYTTNDAAILAGVGADGCAGVSIRKSGNLYISAVYVEVDRVNSGTERTCVFAQDGNCDNEGATVCAGGGGWVNGVTTWVSANDVDSDADGICDRLDPDLDDDGDGIDNSVDNCRLVANPDQADLDGNGVGTVCDDPDGDGLEGSLDNCPNDANADQADQDGNGIGTACDDLDGDGLDNMADNCPGAANPDQADSDGNGEGDACASVLAAVPWLGNEAQPHQVYSGGTLVLQAAAYQINNGAPVELASASWDPGDGWGPQPIPADNSRVLQLDHVYVGAINQPFTATITATGTNGVVYTDTFKVVIQADTLDTRVNMTIDHGLWNLHMRTALTAVDGGKPAAFWSENNAYFNAATASSLQAFQINGHRPAGDPTRDPYVSNVRLGLTWLFDHLRVVDVTSLQGTGGLPLENADSNGNTVGLGPSASHETYISGQIIDAIVSSGLQNAIADAGDDTHVEGRTYRDIVIDMLDLYHWGQSDTAGGGGWNYNWYDNSGERRDSSASHWWAVGVLAAETWGIDAPQWVKDRNLNAMPTWQPAPNGTTNDNCRCGYSAINPIWDGGTNVTPACLLMLEADDVAQDDPRFECSERWISNNFAAGMGNMYTMFQTAKSMRLARDAAGGTASIDLMDGARDWYAGDGDSATIDGYAEWLVENFGNETPANGTWPGVGTAGTNVRGDLRTAWGVIILSPTVFELGPRADCDANPLIDGTADLGGLVTFDGSGSTHDDPEGVIVSYDWDFRDGGSDTGILVDYAFQNIGIWNVQLTVTDSAGLRDTVTCPVDVRDNDIPPNPNAGGPYQICLGDTLFLDGSGSTDLDNDIVAWDWDYTGPLDFNPVDISGAIVDVTGVFAAVGVYDVGLRVTDNDGANGGSDHSEAEFTTVTVIPSDDPSCNQPPIALCADQTVDADAQCLGSASIDNGSSNPDDDPLMTIQDPAGPYPLGTTEVVLTISDGQADAMCVASVLVVDNTPPTVTCDEPVTVNTDDGVCFSSHVVTAQGADNCDADVTIVSDAPAPLPGTVTTDIIFTASDDAGNEATCETSVTVNDVEPPTVECELPTVCVAEVGGDGDSDSDSNSRSNDDSDSDSHSRSNDDSNSGSNDDSDSDSRSNDDSDSDSDSGSDDGCDGKEFTQVTFAGSDNCSVVTTATLTCGATVMDIEAGTNLDIKRKKMKAGEAPKKPCRVTLKGEDDSSGSDYGPYYQIKTEGHPVVLNVNVVDGSGNVGAETCTRRIDPELKGKAACNQGVGNGADGCDPGNSNQGDDANTNDEGSDDEPGNPGKKNKRGR